jgi:sugar lactone lactonase YvrE/acetylornithine deacetylase/succinyl-diaminopimelate desuccinylase-like protein
MRIPPDLLKCLEARLPATLDLLARMVGINSHTLNLSGLQTLSQVTIEAFAGLGFTPEFVTSENPAFGQHLVLSRTGAGTAHVGFISHLDTVFTAAEEVRNQFHWRVVGDRVYGPGTEDIKGGTALMWLVLHAVRETQPDLFEQTRWTLLLDASEEMASADFGRLAAQRLQGAQAALVFEAGMRNGNQFQLVTARKGRATFRVEVTGRGAHAGNAHARGANAIAQLAHTVGQIEALTDHAAGVTFNVGLISGGTSLNRVPHHAVAHAEMRAFTLEAYHAALARLRALENEMSVRSVNDQFPCRVHIHIENETPPWPRNPGTELLLNCFEQAGADLGFQITREERAGLSDGNHIWQSVPTLDGLGPMGDNAHCSEASPDGSKDQEYAEISSFIPKAALNVGALIHLFKSQTMKTCSLLLASSQLLLVAGLHAAETNTPSSIIEPGATLQRLAHEFKFTEGPTCDRDGNVFFTDQPNNRIMKWSVEGQLSTFLQPSGRANGMFFDRDGSLIACADEKNELWSISTNGTHTVLAKEFNGAALNGPNDVWIHPDGAMYFTDPYYQRAWWAHTSPPQPSQQVYRLASDRKKLIRLTDDLKQPNGIIGTPDGKQLFVADIGAKRTYRYDIAADGSLTNRTLHCSLGSDGITLDTAGNLYLTGRGVTVFDKSGKQVEQIDVPERWTANVSFGGKDHRTLFITASEGLYSIRVQHPGANAAK